MIRFVFFGFLLISDSLFSQNLIQNGGFENASFIKKYHIQASKAKYWSIPNYSTPDLICEENKELDVFENRKEIYHDIRSGNKAVGFANYLSNDNNYREQITNILKSTLIKDSLYYFSLYTRNRIHSQAAIDHLEVLFTRKKFKIRFDEMDSDYYPSISYNKLVIKNGDFITNSSSWVKICGVYKAKGGEKFISIGLFDNKNNIELIVFKKNNEHYNSWIRNSIYMYIDDVSLIPIQDSAQCDCNIKRINLESIQKDSVTKVAQNKIISREGTIISLKNLHFDNDSYKIKPESFKELDKLYALLSSNPNLKISVNGYTDNVGSIKYNLRLSEQRAKAVVDYLIEKGISKERLKYQGYGEDNPIQTNETEEGRAVNRRVEVEFLNKKFK